jgi:hypothetical protein
MQSPGHDLRQQIVAVAPEELVDAGAVFDLDRDQPVERPARGGLPARLVKEEIWQEGIGPNSDQPRELTLTAGARYPVPGALEDRLDERLGDPALQAVHLAPAARPRSHPAPG